MLRVGMNEKLNLTRNISHAYCFSQNNQDQATMVVIDILMVSRGSKVGILSPR